MREPFVTIADAAYVLAVDPVTIRRWIASGRLAAVRVGGTAVRIPQAAIAALTGPDYDPDEWVTIANAAALYSVSEHSIRRWIQQREVETRRLGTRATSVNVRSLDKLKLAYALGHPTLTPQAAKAVSRSVRALTDAGAITLLNTPHTGKRAEYRLHIAPATGTRSAGSTQGEDVPAQLPTGTRSVAERYPADGVCVRRTMLRVPCGVSNSMMTTRSFQPVATAGIVATGASSPRVWGMVSAGRWCRGEREDTAPHQHVELGCRVWSWAIDIDGCSLPLALDDPGGGDRRCTLVRPSDDTRGDAPVLTWLGNGVVEGELRDRVLAPSENQIELRIGQRPVIVTRTEWDGVGAGEQEDLALRQLVAVGAERGVYGNHRELGDPCKPIHPLQNPGVRKDTRVEIEWHLRRQG